MHTDDESVEVHVAVPREELEDRSERRSPEEQQQTHQREAQERSSTLISPETPEASDDPDADEHAHDRQAPAVEELTAEEPAEDLLDAEGVVPEGALVVLTPR